MVHRLVQVFAHVCADCSPSMRTPTAVFRAVNKRIRELNRRSKASRAAPGYVLDSLCAPGPVASLCPVPAPISPSCHCLDWSMTRNYVLIMLTISLDFA